MKFKQFIYFYPEKPVLVHRDQPLVDEFSADDDYVAEPKYNGARCILVVLNGEMELTIGGVSRTLIKGDQYFLPDGVEHSAKIHAGYADITFFNQPDRFGIK